MPIKAALPVSLWFFAGILISVTGSLALADSGLNAAELILVIMAGAAYLIILFAAVQGKAWALEIYFGLSVFFIDASFRAREYEDISIDGQTILKMIIWLGAFLIGVAQLPNTHRFIFKSPYCWIFVFAIWTLATSVYSVTPTYTLGNGFIFASIALFVPAIMVHLSQRQVLVTLAAALFVFIVVSWGVYWWFPDLGGSIFWTPDGVIYRMSGLASHANNLGRVTAIFVGSMFCLLMYRFIRIHFLSVLPILLGVVTLLYTDSRTSIGALLIACFFVFFRRKPLLSWIMAIPVMLIVLVVNFLNKLNVVQVLTGLSRSGSIEEIYTFTDRTLIWKLALDKIREMPLLGYGYGSSRIVISSGYQSAGGWTAPHAHNMFLQSLVTTGIIGTVFVVLVLVLKFREMVQSPDYFQDWVLIFVIATGLLEAGAIGVAPALLTLIWVISICWTPKSVVKKNGAGIGCGLEQQ